MAEQDRDDLERRVRRTIAGTFGVDPPPERELTMGDPPQWDSLGHMSLVVAIEAEFQVSFPAHAIATLTSTRAIIDAVMSLAARRQL
jgi:acyl carrier protein